MRTMHFLTDVYGPRLTGSPNLKAAQDWIVKETTVGAEERASRAVGVRASRLGERAAVGARDLAVQGFAGRRGAGVDAGHQRRGDRAGRCRSTVPSSADQGRADEVLRREPREGEGQDRDGRRAGRGAGHDPHRRRSAAKTTTCARSTTRSIPQQQNFGGGGPQARPESERRAGRAGRRAARSVPGQPPARSAASTTPAASTARSAPSTTAPSTSRRRCRRW